MKIVLAGAFGNLGAEGENVVGQGTLLPGTVLLHRADLSELELHEGKKG